MATIQTRREGTLQRWATFVAGVGVGVALGTGQVAWATDIDKTYAKLRVFGQVLSYVQQSYVDPVDDTALIYNAIAGMLADLDPYSTFMRPGEYQKLREDTAGEFGGLGIEISDAGEVILIDGVIEGGPAARAGLRPQDRIVKVDGEAVSKLGMAAAVERMRGVPGTKIVLTVMRAGWTEARDIPLVRRNVRVRSVESRMLDDTAAYIRIRSFQERTDHDVGRALYALKKEARARGKKLRGLVLDLRDNPGGLFDEGVKVADRFLAEGEIVRTEGRNPRNVERQYAHPKGADTTLPVVILSNGGTASASEILAGALQDQKRAYVVGTKSYGKGSVQTLFGLDDGSGLKLTVARYFTPSGRSINEHAIAPDLVVEPGRTTSAHPSADPLLEDRQVRAALQALDEAARLASR